MRITESEIAVIRQYFQDKPVLKAFVFGSYVRGDADGESDLDILVELDYNEHIGLGFINMQLELQDMLHKKVDLVSNNAISPHIQPFINKDKILVYER